MTREEVIAHFGIPAAVLTDYESGELGVDVGSGGVPPYNDADIDRLSIILALSESGFPNGEIAVYMRLLAKGDTDACQHLLNRKRTQSLSEIHRRERQLDRLDYLRKKGEDV